MFFSSTTQQKGFTLVELMVVISIISTLSSVVLASTNTARVKARDAERVATLHQIQLALELYYNDHGEYPVGTAFSAWDNWTGFDNWRNANPRRPRPMEELISGGYILKINDDPINTETYPDPGGTYLGSGPPDDLSYVYCSGNQHGNCPAYPTTQTYVLGANLEGGGPSPDNFGNFQLH